MKILLRLAYVLCAASLLLPSVAAAQGEWKYQLAPYLWFAGLKGTVATIPGAPRVAIDISPSDALSDLKVGFMGAFEAKKGRHGGFADLVYTDVRSDTELVPAIGLTLKSKSKSTIVTGGYVYALYNQDATLVDVFAGARYWKVDTELGFGGGLGLLAGRSVRNSESWWDPVVGIKARTALGGSKFFLSGVLAMGGFGAGSDLFTDATGLVGYQWSKPLSTVLGYRSLDVKYEKSSFYYDVRQSGWMLGMAYAF